MKKLFTVSICFLVLLAGMRVSIASHFCGGELAAVKLSLAGTLASCGMTHEAESVSYGSVISTNCCEDETSVYKTDENYSTSEFKFKHLSHNIIQEFSTPAQYIKYNFFSSAKHANVSPPGYYPGNSPNLADLCILRI